MGWAAIIQAIVQGVSNAFSTFSYIKEQKSQAKEIAEQAQEQANERAKKAKYAMQEQKTSFLKSGVYFDSGSPLDVINETYNTMNEDINAINKDSVKQQQKLLRAGRTAFWSFALDPLGNNGGQFANNIYQGFQNNNNASFNGMKNNSKLMSGGPSSSKMTNTKFA